MARFPRKTQAGLVIILLIAGVLYIGLRPMTRFLHHREGIDRTKSVICVAFAPDGKTMASAQSDGTVTLWAVPSKAVAHVLHTPAGPTAIEFSPDGKTFATASWAGDITLWDLSTKAQLSSLTGATGANKHVATLAFCPVGNGLASGGAPGDNTVRLWNLETKDSRVVIRGRRLDGMTQVLFSPDGGTLVATSSDGTIRLLNLQTGDLSARDGHLYNGYYTTVVCASFSRSGKRLATGAADRSVKIWEVPGLREVRTLAGHVGRVNGVVFSADDRVLISASGIDPHMDGEVKSWEVDSGAELVTVKGHKGAIHCIAMSPDGRTLVSGGEDGTVRWWETSELFGQPKAAGGR